MSKIYEFVQTCRFDRADGTRTGARAGDKVTGADLERGCLDSLLRLGRIRELVPAPAAEKPAEPEQPAAVEKPTKTRK